MEVEKDDDLKAYSRLAQVPTFRDLRTSVTNYALTKVALEWDNLVRNAASGLPEIGLVSAHYGFSSGFLALTIFTHFTSLESLYHGCCAIRAGGSMGVL